MSPILFNTDMVRAILEGRKTTTRRVVKPQPRMVYYDGELQDSGDNVRDGVPLLVLITEGQNGTLEQIVPPSHPGDILYVRETWEAWSPTYGTTPQIIYKADGYSQSRKIKWRPSIHMPREAARIFLQVTDVRVERLQDITELCILEKEGVTVDFPQPKPSYMSLAYAETRLKPAVRKAFADLWDSTIKPADRALYGWDANPYVWVIEFERCKRPEGG